MNIPPLLSLPSFVSRPPFTSRPPFMSFPRRRESPSPKSTINNPTSFPPTTTSGFTLIEVLVAIMIISAVAIFAGVSFNGIIQKRQLIAATENLASAYQHTQALSITAQKKRAYGIRLSPAGANNQFSLISQEQVTDPVNADQTILLPTRVTIIQPTAEQTLLFSKIQGLPSITTDLQVVLSTTRFHTTLTINTQGNINTTPPTPN